jgi:hypothetical protein
MSVRQYPQAATLALAITLTFTILATPLAAQTQQAEKVYRIGYLGNSSPALELDLVAAFRQGLHDLGYVEGQNILIEYRWAEGRYDRFPDLAAVAATHRIAVIYGSKDWLEVGGLMSYGESLSVMVRRSATYVDKILKGAKPGDR